MSKYVYIVLQNENGLFTHTAKHFTKSLFNHASISLDPSLSIMYSYDTTGSLGTKKSGFTVEKREKLKGKSYICYRIPLREDQFLKVADTLMNFNFKADETKYSYINVIEALLKKQIVKNRNNSKLMCSAFVAYVLNCAGVKLLDDTGYELILPVDIFQSNIIEFVEEGRL